MSEREKICNKLKNVLEDEDKAAIEYLSLASNLEDGPLEQEMLANLLRKVADDEMSHKNALSRAIDILKCPVK